MVKYPGFKWNEERRTRESDQRCRKRSGGESIGEGERCNGELNKVRGPVNSGAEFSLGEPGDGIRCGEGHAREARPHSLWGTGRSGNMRVALDGVV